MGLLEDVGAWTSIIGAMLGVVAIIITILIYKKVQNIENNRRSEQKQHFKKLIINNLEEVLNLYKSVIVLSSRGSYAPEEIDEKTQQLYNFFKKNQENILSLIRDTKFYASMLSVVDTPTNDMDNVLEKIRWLTGEFYIMEYSIERNKRHWVSKEQELQNNKDFIEKTLSSLNKP